MEGEATSLSIIESVSLQQIGNTLTKIAQFQELVHSQLKQNQDFGIIPGTPKPTLLKPGAEKIIMLMGLRSEFDIADSTRNWQEGFFQYQVRCKLFKGDTLITEGLGAANTKERKFIKQDAFTIDNTILKMAKKRAMIDATLLVASLSEVFTQDVEDLDLQGMPIQESVQASKQTTDDGAIISEAQAKRMFALSKGNADLVKTILTKHGYEHSRDVKKADYEAICKEIEG
jgi:hypothetical protein